MACPERYIFEEERRWRGPWSPPAGKDDATLIMTFAPAQVRIYHLRFPSLPSLRSWRSSVSAPHAHRLPRKRKIGPAALRHLRQQVRGLRRHQLHELPGRPEPAQAHEPGRRRRHWPPTGSPTTSASPATTASKAEPRPSSPTRIYNRVAGLSEHRTRAASSTAGPRTATSPSTTTRLPASPGHLRPRHPELPRRPPRHRHRHRPLPQPHQRPWEPSAAASTSTTNPTSPSASSPTSPSNTSAPSTRVRRRLRRRNLSLRQARAHVIQSVVDV